MTVYALKNESIPAYETVDGINIVRVNLSTRRLGLGILARLLKLVEYTICTCWVAYRDRADVYHAHDANTLFVAWLPAKLRGAPLIYDAHEFEAGRNWGNSTLPPFFRKLWTLPERLFIRAADAVITVSESIAAELESYLSNFKAAGHSKCARTTRCCDGHPNYVISCRFHQRAPLFSIKDR